MNLIVPQQELIVGPTRRWRVMRAHAVQHAYITSPARFNIAPAGRRSGKTEIAKRRLVKKALMGTAFTPGARFFAAAPVRQQAKDIYWNDLKALVPDFMKKGAPSEGELVIRLITGDEIHVEGLDKPERIEGQPWDWGILDEYGNMKKQAWGAHVRPSLSDRNGGCDLIGVPEGMNHYYELYSEHQNDTTGEFRTFHWVSADILPAHEIESARGTLDALTFDQEYNASFLNFAGRAYYPFTTKTHVKPLQYDPNRDLIICFDFNVSPGTASILQEQKLPSGLFGTGCIGEVHIPQNSNTPRVCEKIIADWKDHKGDVYCYGDATGGARGTAKVEGSDWELIKKHLKPVFGDRLKFRVPPANPAERQRVNSLNSRIQAVNGDIRFMVDPKCKFTIKDFEGVTVIEGTNGELDKKTNPALTHLTDGIGYYVHAKFPVADRSIITASAKGH